MPNAAARLDHTVDDPSARALRTHRLGTTNFTTCPHCIPNIGPRVFLVFEEHGIKYSLNLTTANARLVATCLTVGACEAEAMERTARHKAEQRASRASLVESGS